MMDQLFDSPNEGRGISDADDRPGARPERDHAPAPPIPTPLYLSESYAAVPAAVARTRELIGTLAASAGASEQQLDDLRLAVSEAVTNAVAYAYPGAPGEVHVMAAVVSDGLWVVIADDGEGMSARAGHTGGLGLGLGLMSQLSDDLTILTRSSGGVEVRMRFALSGRPGGPAARDT